MSCPGLRLGRRLVRLRHPASAAGSVLDPLLRDCSAAFECRRPQQSLQPLEVVWVGRIQGKLVTGCRCRGHQVRGSPAWLPSRRANRGGQCRVGEGEWHTPAKYRGGLYLEVAVNRGAASFTTDPPEMLVQLEPIGTSVPRALMQRGQGQGLTIFSRTDRTPSIDLRNRRSADV
jgi:hypothetical protein